MSLSKPYIVVFGNVGAGKSALFEKLTGVRGRVGTFLQSFTHTAEVYDSYDRSMILCDTPGVNSINDSFQRNLRIAHAMNFAPVTCVLIICKADIRIDNVVQNVREYAENFLPEDFPLELLSVCITHMDQVSWRPANLKPHLRNHLGIESVIFSSLQTTKETLRNAILAECRSKRPVRMDIDSEKFLKLFKIPVEGLKVLRQSKKEVGRFDKMRQDFHKVKTTFSHKDQMNMTLQFQTWLIEELIRAQTKLAVENGFPFCNDSTIPNEAAHIASMTNQIRRIISDIRVETFKYHRDVDANFKKCPHCGLVWQKVEGSNSSTTCGSRPSQRTDHWSGDMSTFSFFWDDKAEQLKVTKLQRVRPASAIGQGRGSSRSVGCGKVINWSLMAPVLMPVEYNIAPSSTADVKCLPPAAQPKFKQCFDNAMRGLPQLRVQRV